jgi:hypothetical protein
MASTDLVFYLFLLCVVLWYLRHMNNKYQATKFMYRMSELRTKLKTLAYKGIIAECNMYYYFDDTFKTLIDQHRRLNVYTISYLYFHHKSAKKTVTNDQTLKNYCESHPELEALYKDYRLAIYNYLKGQHKIIHLIISSMSGFVSASSNIFKALNTDLVKGLVALPGGVHFWPNRSK